MRKTASRRTPAKPSGFRANDILELRRTLGALIGKKTASRQLIARLIESSPGSIFNWERGTAPSKHYVARLQDLKRRAETGELNLGKGGAARRGQPPRSADGVSPDPRSSADASLAPSNVRPIFVNTVFVASEDETSWLRFGLKRPGARSAEAIVELVIPTRLLRSLRVDHR